MAKKNRVHITRIQTETATISYDGPNPFEIVFVREGSKIRFAITNVDRAERTEITLSKAGLQALIDEANKFINSKTDLE
jgi:hypothetical protein